MKKVAIVGVEGSGKTVMLAGLGDLYTYPDENGYFLAPKNFGTAAYVSEKIARMRKGEWPVATAGDEMQGLDWTLSRQKDGGRGRPENVCEVSFLDFPGEVYRAAYGVSGGGDAALREQAEELTQYVRGADELIVLINLRDVIANGLGDKRVQEAMWITKSILDNALGDADNKRAPRAAIVLSQADSYAETIKACGGAPGVLRKYLPYVANSYGWLDVFSASAVDKTVLNDDGNAVPAADFTAQGLVPILKWIRGGTQSSQADTPTGVPKMVRGVRQRIRRRVTPIGVPKAAQQSVDSQQQAKEEPLYKSRSRSRAIKTILVASFLLIAGVVRWWTRPSSHGSNLGHEEAYKTTVAAFKSIREQRQRRQLRGVEPADRRHAKVQLWEDGPYWAETNIGAEEPWEPGYYFWWGDTVGYKRQGDAWVASDGSKSNFSFEVENTPTYDKSISNLRSEGWITSDNVLALEHDAAHVHWGGDWRMPTDRELQDFSEKCDWTLTTTNGFVGNVVRGRGKYASSSIFLPCAGLGQGPSLGLSGSFGGYWASVPNSDNVYYSSFLHFHSVGHGAYGSNRYHGRAVRPVQGFAK